MHCGHLMLKNQNPPLRVSNNDLYLVAAKNVVAASKECLYCAGIILSSAASAGWDVGM